MKSINNIFEMVKADRYTADGREEIIKAQEAETQDARRYKTGEISEATGLQKQPDGSWAPPKSTKYGKVTTNKEGKVGIQQTLGKGSKFEEFANEKSASRALANLTAGYNTTERSKQDPHSDQARFMKHLDKETKQMARENKKSNAGSEKVVIRQGPNTKELNETVQEHLNKHPDAYKGYDDGSMRALVMSPSGYELSDQTKTKSGKTSSVYVKGKNKITLYYDKNGELENIDTGSAHAAQFQNEAGAPAGAKQEAAAASKTFTFTKAGKVYNVPASSPAEAVQKLNARGVKGFKESDAFDDSTPRSPEAPAEPKQEEIGKFYTKFDDAQGAYDAGRQTFPEGGYTIFKTPEGKYKVVDDPKTKQRMQDAGYEVEVDVPDGTKPPKRPVSKLTGDTKIRVKK